MARILGAIIAVFLGIAGPFLVIALIGHESIKALGRNPAASNRIFLSMLFSFVFTDAIAVIIMLVIYNIFR